MWASQQDKPASGNEEIDVEHCTSAPTIKSGTFLGPATATKDDIISCYRTVLKREPESESVIDELIRKNLAVMDIVSAFLESPEYRIKNFRNSIDKCSENYLSKNFSLKERYACFCTNFSFLTEIMPEAVFASLMGGHRMQIAMPSLAAHLHVAFHITHEVANEGEISLTMYWDEDAMYTLSFTVCPGSLLGYERDSIILISRMQASRGKRLEIATATREMQQTTPQTCLFHMLVGLAEIWGINIIAGVRFKNQLSFGEDKAETLTTAYDHFYESMGFERFSDSFYIVRLPLQSKPLRLIKACHRTRTKKKRLFKARLAHEAGRAWTLSA